MLTLLWSARASAIACPPGQVAHLYNSATNVTLSAGDWFYFYSDYILLGDTLTVRVLPKSASASLYTGAGLSCPGNDSAPAKAGIAANQWAKYQIPVSDSLGLQIFGVRADGDTDVVVAVEGENPNNADRAEWILLGALFLVVILVLLVAMFVHAILARGKVHYQVDLGE
jgi:hypothetical protein